MKYQFIKDYTANYPPPACTKENPPCITSTVVRSKTFKKGEVIDGTPKFASATQPKCIKAPCPPIIGTNLVGISTNDGLTIPMNVLSEVNNTNKWTAHPRRDECLKKFGLPGWFDGDPMLAKPQLYIEPKKTQAYYDCRDSENDSQTQKKGESRDAWTGGVEWGRFFNIRTFLFIVLVIYLFYLFLKYVMPLIKQNFGKK